MPDQPTRDDADRKLRSIDELRKRAERVERERDRLQRENDRLRRELERVKRQLDEAGRAGHRQAAPFGRSLVPQPRRPGRKAGATDGRKADRRRPRRVDETYDAPLPNGCPHYGGPIRDTGRARQYQDELPVACVVVRAFRIRIGRGRACQRRVQGRHPLQTSDALGAARVQLGAQAVAFAVILNKQLGLSFGKIATLFRQQYLLTITRSGVVHALHRAARQARPTSTALCQQIRGSPVVTPDETGWKVAG